MHVVVAASQKGGAGKTTLVRNLAVAAAADGAQVALLDYDPQGTLTGWWNRRQAETPILAAVDRAQMHTGLEKLRAAGMQQVYIDTPPSVHPWIGEVIAHASLVIVPVRPSPDDLDAVGPTLDLIEAARVNFSFVVMQAKARTKLAVEAVPALAQHGKVAPIIIHDRTDFPTAAARGLGVTEHAEGSSAADELRALLAYVNTQLRKQGAMRAHG